MSVTITISTDLAADAIHELKTLASGLGMVNPQALSSPVTYAPEAGLVYGNEGEADNPAPAPTRKRGEPSPGKTRRTKAEIAEDDAAEAAGASNIRSGSDDRPDPENPVDDAETEAADAADEAAEADASRDADAPLTIDDVKALAVEYQEKYGFEAVQEDGAKIFVEALGKPPEGEPHWKFSIVPTDQAVLVKLAGVWRKAIDLNPLKREVKAA